jgi:DNA repair protein RadD
MLDALAPRRAFRLRDYQNRALAAYWDARDRGATVVCLASPTGSGKTVMGGAWAWDRVYDTTYRVAWIAHRQELLDQAARLEIPGVEFAMVQSHNATRRAIEAAEFVVLDECHHLYGTPRWSQAIAGCRGKPTLALTATPERGDGTAPSNLIDAIITVAQPKELIAAGHLVPCEVIAPAKQVQQMAEHPLQAWRDHGENRQTIVYCRDLKHARQIAQDFFDAGVPAACVEGEMDPELRAAKLRAHQTGELRVLTNVHLLTEGYDDPRVSCGIMACGVATTGAWIQRCGRFVRPSPGKTKAIIIDLRGSVYQWGLPDEDRIYSLEGRAIRTAAEAEEAIRQCRNCQRVFRAREFEDATCPACGARCKGKPDPRVRREAMARVLETHTEADKNGKLASLIAQGRAKGYKPQWAFVQFRIRYGHYPTKAQRGGA